MANDIETAERAEAEYVNRTEALPGGYVTGEECEGFHAGFAAGLAHARQWRELTADPATWPAEGQHILARHRDTDGVSQVRWSSTFGCAWDYWFPVPLSSPPEAL